MAAPMPCWRAGCEWVRGGNMSRRCQITGKKPLVGNRVSHANNKSKRRQLPNLQYKRIHIPELNRWVRVRLSTRAMRTLSKKGLMRFLKDEGKTLKDLTG
jgi:large subunit ribosomal protein L28